MKKTYKISVFLSILLMILTICVLYIPFFNNGVDAETSSETQSAETLPSTQKTKPVITSSYENGICELVYNGVDQYEDVKENIHINSDQQLIFKRVLEGGDIEAYEFENIGEYHMRISAEENDTFLEPDPLDLIVRVLPRTLLSESSGIIGKITIINDSGFCLDNEYCATDIAKKQKRAIKKAVKKMISYEEEIIEMVKLLPNKEAQKYSEMSIAMELPNNYAASKNYRIFEYTSGGELKEISYIINRGDFALSNIAADSIIIVSANKRNPYLWIWVLVAGLSLVGMAVMIYFIAPRKLHFYLEGSKIYVVKLGRRQGFTLSDGLENYEWYVDKNYSVKARSFGVGETSKKYYAKIKR